MSLMNVLPIPAAPPRSPKKKRGPRPIPTSTLLRIVIDCENDLNDEETVIRIIAITRAIGTIRFIDTRFSGFSYWIYRRKIEKKKIKSNQGNPFFYCVSYLGFST
jgi:hypothetical protein